VLLNIGFTMALTFLKRESIFHSFVRFLYNIYVDASMLTKYIDPHSAPGNSRAFISREKYNQLQGKINDRDFFDKDMTLTAAPAKSSTETKKGVLVFFLLSSILTFSICTEAFVFVDCFMVIYIGHRVIERYLHIFTSVAINNFCRKDGFAF